VLGEAAANGAGLLGAEVEREILLVLVRLPQRRLLLLRHHREHARDGGAHHLAAKSRRLQLVSIRWVCKQTRGRRHVHLGQLVGGAAGDLGDAEEGELGLEFLELRLQLRLVLPPKLVHLDPGCDTTTAASDPQKENPTKSKRVLVTAWLTHGDGGSCSGSGEAEAEAAAGREGRGSDCGGL
jgi:hypothetical protein